MTAFAWLSLAGARLVADVTGALFWPDQDLVVVADLHLEKGSSFARRGQFLPPYDTAATLARLAEVLQRFRPRRVISLGDGFHDAAGTARLAAADRLKLRQLVAAHDWIWVAGNHDPGPPEALGGASEAALQMRGITFRHCPQTNGEAGEIAGHLHPKASVSIRSRSLSRPCFVSDARRLLLPAFGSYAGGLDVRDPAIAGLFRHGCGVRVLGRRGVYLVAAEPSSG